MRYERPTCEECVRLEAQFAALFQAYLAARNALTLTPKDDPAFSERRLHLDKVVAQLAEARARDDLHERTHEDQF